MQVRWLALILLTVLLVGCRSFDRQEMLRDIVDGVVLPNHEAFAVAAKALDERAQAYVADPSAENLDSLQVAWHTASIAWMGCDLFRFDTISRSLLHNRIDNPPPWDGFIEEIIAGGEPISADSVNNVGSSSKGLPAIEYLIFDPASVADIATNERRQAYLLGATTILANDANELLVAWSADGQNYAQTFIDNELKTGDLQESLNLLVNQMLTEIETITWTRLGVPLGKRNNGDIHPERVESRYAHASLDRIRATAQTVHDTYRASEASGIDAYLNYLEADYNGEPLATVIDAQFVTTLDALDAIDGTLSEAIVNDFDTVDNAFTELRTLITLLKSDMVNHLGVTLTFNDTDGD